MSDKKKILFVINPKSGNGKAVKIASYIEKYIDKHKIEYKILYTEYPGHAKEIAQQNKDIYHAIIAVGGDGSVHEVGCELIDTNTILGIIPVGSGNGIARHLKIQMKVIKALRAINNFNVIRIDTGTVNEHKFIGFCGFGFDAYIAKCFAHRKNRGFWGYVQAVISQYKTYNNKTLSIRIDGKIYNMDYFILTVFNINQYGNNLIISPFSNTTDAQFELIAIRKIPLWKIVLNVFKLVQGKIHQLKEYKAVKFNNEFIVINKQIDLQADGEYLNDLSERIFVKINPLSLNILI